MTCWKSAINEKKRKNTCLRKLLSFKLDLTWKQHSPPNQILQFGEPKKQTLSELTKTNSLWSGREASSLGMFTSTSVLPPSLVLSLDTKIVTNWHKNLQLSGTAAWYHSTTVIIYNQAFQSAEGVWENIKLWGEMLQMAIKASKEETHSRSCRYLPEKCRRNCFNLEIFGWINVCITISY